MKQHLNVLELLPRSSGFAKQSSVSKHLPSQRRPTDWQHSQADTAARETSFPTVHLYALLYINTESQANNWGLALRLTSVVYHVKASLVEQPSSSSI